MKSTITWLEATEDNVRAIPFSGDITEMLLVRTINTTGNIGYCTGNRNIYSDIWQLNMVYSKVPTVTHFAYINEPE